MFIKHKHYAILVLTILSCITPCMATSIGAYDITVTDEYVQSTARCSCGTSDYSYGTATFLNYCPGCGHYGCLHYEVGDYYGADYTSPEGLWYCAYCDRDRN
ncbi:hypothetical protein [Methanobacterium ferruginis]|uniref:hypothetical protein n=1 Tax=Methanobacterium ferruginis TaxID=710191 RepID=UPI002573CB8C|nr:hypothetical protein [Methanobacterium ferruginis]